MPEYRGNQMDLHYGAAQGPDVTIPFGFANNAPILGVGYFTPWDMVWTVLSLCHGIETSS